MSDKIDVSGLDIEKLKALRAQIDSIIVGSPERLGDLDGAVAELKAVKGRVADVGKQAVTRAIRMFLTAHPEVESIRWSQYTPYWNDGEPCEFGVNDPEVKLVGSKGDEGDREGGYVDVWSLDYYAKKEGKPKPEALIRDAKQLHQLMEEAEDAMKATFGDHVQVTVGRDLEAEVEEYSHD